MVLAELLSQKLCRPSISKQEEASKGVIKPTVAGFTRTAERKRRKLDLLARRQQQKEQKLRKPAVFNDVDASDEEVVIDRPYEALLESLQCSSKYFANKYRQRRKEQEGLSDSDEDDEEGKDASDDDDENQTDELEVTFSEDPQSGCLKTPHEEEDEEEEPIERDFYSLRFDQLCAPVESPSTEYTDVPQSLQAWLPDAIVQSTIPVDIVPRKSLAGYAVKERLAARWNEIRGHGKTFTDHQQRVLFALLNSYQDILHASKPYPVSPHETDKEMDVVLLHILNHCATSADKIKKNNDRIKMSRRGESQQQHQDLPRDQGFCRPKVLILLPMRSMAHKVVCRLTELAINETRTDSIQNKDRFNEEFGPDEEGGGPALSKRAKAGKAAKPADFQTLFHHGNLDDHFRLGIKLTRGAVKLYADFLQSDIIVASPLGLATLLEEAQAQVKGKEENKKLDNPNDVLSSIEIVVLGRADVLLMQNWSHVATVMSALNKMPQQQYGVDIMRVRDYFLSGQAEMYRQTVIFSSFMFPEASALLRSSSNGAGKVRLRPHLRGVLSSIVPQIRQVFERFSRSKASRGDAAASPSAAMEAEARFQHFCHVAWPRIQESARSGGQLIFVPSYFDFVRVRNFLKSQSASFFGLCEYTEKSEAARSRSLFYDGRKSVVVYTERAHFYGRHTLRGVKDILFYQLPQHSAYYSELLNFLEESAAGGLPGVTVIFSKLDGAGLEGVVGSKRADTMLKGKTSTFLFC